MNVFDDPYVLLHSYICEGCFEDVPLTVHQYEKAMDYRGRLLCERCLETRLAARPRKRRPARREGAGTDGAPSAPSRQ